MYDDFKVEKTVYIIYTNIFRSKNIVFIQLSM